MWCCCYLFSGKVSGTASFLVIFSSRCKPTFVHESPLCFHDSKLRFPFNLKRHLNLPLKYPQVAVGIVYWGQTFSFTSKISLFFLFFLFFSFLFQDLISLGLRGQIIPENLRLLLVWYIQAPNCPGYFYRFLWTEISVDMSFFRLPAFSLSAFFSHFLCPFLLLKFLFIYWMFNTYIACAFRWWDANPHLLLGVFALFP